MAVSATALSPETADTASGIPVVVFVHGRGQQGLTIDSVRATFLDTFTDNERAMLGTEVVPRPDLDFVWYADAIDPAFERMPTAPGCRYLGRTKSEANQSTNETLRRGLLALAAGLDLDAIGLQILTQDTFKYLSSPETRCEADARLETELEARGYSARPVVLVAHSMGGIVSFSAIEKNAQIVVPQSRLRVVHFVTLGTQVGVDLILKGIEGRYSKPPVPVPNNVARWTNFINLNDSLAFSTDLGFKASDPSRLPLDVRIDQTGTSSSRHAITTYLRSKQVIETIARAWCEANRDRPSQCNVVLP